MSIEICTECVDKENKFILIFISSFLCSYIFLKIFRYIYIKEEILS